jgi:hypothetical protein
MAGPLQALDPNGDMPLALKHRMVLAHDAQRVEGFAWPRMNHLRYVDVPGLRFVPTLGDVLRRKARRYGWARWVGLPFMVVPLLLGRDVWVGLDPTWLKLLYSVPIALVVALGLFLFWSLGPDPTVKVGVAQGGLYFTPNLLTKWTVNPGTKDNIWMVPRDQVRRFFSTTAGTGNGATVWVEYVRANGQVDKRKLGLPGLGSDDAAWLERWRETGSLPLPADPRESELLA